MAGNCRCDMVELVAKAQWSAKIGSLGRKVHKEARGVRLAKRSRDGANQNCRFTKAFQLEAHLSQLPGGSFEPVAIGLVELDNLGNEQALAGNQTVIPRSPH